MRLHTLPPALLRRRYYSTPTNLKTTLLLPKTTFPIRPSGDPARHAALLRKSTTELYSAQSQRADRSTFILHDGPPYANGELHMGHALNKILKDVVNRVAVLEGKRVVFIPGWDCHGLPIELKALQRGAGGKGSIADAVQRGRGMSDLDIRQQARELAEETIRGQMRGFTEWAVMGEWERAYKTLEPEYELRQLEVFRDMLKRGLVYRRFKPVYWSPSSGTALAEAELEYNEKHSSRAAFVKFALREPVAGEDSVAVVVWTTTPWTLPSNKAVAVGEGMGYSIISTREYGKLLVADERVSYVCTMIGDSEATVLQSGIPGKDLVGRSYTHPLFPATHPVIAANFVSADSGTGLVHLAPGHGMEDYLVCLSHGITPFSPVDNNGRYTADTLPELQGLEVLYAGNKTVLEMLTDAGALLHVHKFTHKYPYDWRTKLPVIVRATAQWFADAEGIKAAAVEALEDVRFIPESGRSRLTAFVRGRNEWCISRQRAWGVPIPALYDAETGEPLLTEENVDHVISVLREKGTDAWFSPSIPDSEFLAPQYRASGRTYIRGKETMDVWFDSGTSWSTLSSRLGGDVTADLYLEGSDQHRGWFQSSLLTSIAARGSPPFKQILTHGFVLDAKGKKMSKSLGNVIAPADVTHSSKGVPNIDLLRLWVAFADYTKDVTIGPTVLNHVQEVLRKARVTSRFLLGILHDWDGTHTPYPSLSIIDKIALSQLARVNSTVRAAAAAYNFNRAVTALAQYSSTGLSAFYLDVIKDRVYSDAEYAPTRKAAQSTAALVLRNYVSLLAPFAPVLTQEVWAHAPENLLRSVPEEERGMLAFFTPEAQWVDPRLEKEWEVLQTVHEAVKRGFERAKAAGRVKVNLEVAVTIVAPSARARELLERYRLELEQLCIVSGVAVIDARPVASGEWWEEVETVGVAGEGVQVVVREAAGAKCARCWVYKAPVEEEGSVCIRCEEVLRELEGRGR
jgi:isoleucyl-tRNA synthetase